MYDRRYRRYYRRRNRGPLSGLAGGVVLIGLAFAFLIGHGGFFLPVFFLALAISALLGSLGSFSRGAVYGGFQGFVWLAGLAFCFLVGFWPWILVVAGISAILGALYVPIMGGLLGLGFLAANQPPPYQQPYPQYPQGQEPYQGYQPPPQSYQPYQQGYQPPPPQPAPGTYSEGGQQHQYPQQPQNLQPPQYEQPQVHYPQEEELPPQQ